MTLSTPTDNRIRKHIVSTDMRPILAHWPASTPATVEAINPDADSAFTLRLDVLPGIFGGPLPALAWLRAGNLSPEDLERAAALLLPAGAVAPVESDAPTAKPYSRHAIESKSFSTATHDVECWGSGHTKGADCIVAVAHGGSPRFRPFNAESEDEKALNMHAALAQATHGATELGKGALKVHARGHCITSDARGGSVVWSHPDTGEASTPLMGEWKRLGVNRLYLNDAIRLVGDKRVIIGQGEQNGLSYFVVRGFKDKGGPVVVIAGMRV